MGTEEVRFLGKGKSLIFFRLGEGGGREERLDLYSEV